MNELLRKLLANAGVMAEAPADGIAGGGASEVDSTDDVEGDAGDADAGDGKGGDEPAAPAKGKAPAAPKDPAEGMASAIRAGLKKEKGDDEEGGERKAAPVKETKPKTKTAAEISEESAKVVDEREKAAQKKAEDDKFKGKTTKDFMLSQDERRALSQSANRRFHDLTRLSTRNEERIAVLSEQNAKLQQARDTIMDVMEEHGVRTSAELTPLLQYNKLLVTGDLEGALAMVDEQRAQLLTALGREADGVDLLKDFPDLQAAVENEEITRKAAIETATLRRREQSRRQQDESANQQTQRLQQDNDAREAALTSISQWEAGLTGKADHTDARVAHVNSKMQAVMEKYPPRLWLETIRLIYDNYRAPATTVRRLNGGDEPLRPGGPGGGNHKAPTSMEAAIAQGVGRTNFQQ